MHIPQTVPTSGNDRKKWTQEKCAHFQETEENLQ